MISNFLLSLTFNLKRRLKFYRIMARCTDERRRGVKPNLVLASLIKINEKRNKGKPTALSKLYRHWKEKLDLGKKFGEVLNEVVPAAEASQIYSAEMSGKISNGFLQALEVAKQQAQFKKVFKEALISPIINLVVTLCIVIMFFNTLIPAVSNSITVDKMSPYSLFLYKLSKTFPYWMTIFMIFTTLSVCWLIWALPNYNGSLRKKLDNYPPFSIYKLTIGCSFLFSLTSLMKSRVPQKQALHIINKFSSPYLKYRINKILEQTEKSLGEALIGLKLDFPDKEVIDELAMASDQGNINEALPEVVESLTEDGIDLIKIQAGVAQGITKAINVFILIALVVGLFGFIVDIQGASGM